MNDKPTDWEKTLKDADRQREKAKDYHDQKAQQVAAEESTNEIAAATNAVAAAIRYCGNIMLVSLIGGVILVIISMAITAYQMQQIP